MNDKRKMAPIEIRKREDFFLLKSKKTIAKVKINKVIIMKRELSPLIIKKYYRPHS